MNTWKFDINRGIQLLSRHAPGEALKYFKRALNNCPVYRGDDLPRLLYFMGIALRRLGCNNSAVKSWTVLQKMGKQNKAQKMLHRFSNDYGMAKQESQDQDDWQAFYSIHLSRYLRGFGKQTISDSTEQIMVKDILKSYYDRLFNSGVLEAKSSAEKKKIFCDYRIDFPLFCFPEMDSVLPVDFVGAKRLEQDDLCSCRSGLPYMACCGRTRGEDELGAGL